MEHDIRQMLVERAEDVYASPILSRPTLTRARRRRIVTALTTAFSVAALTIGGLAVAGKITSDPIEPVTPTVRPSLTVGLPSIPRDITMGFGSVWAATDDSLIRVNPGTGKIIRQWKYLGDGFPNTAIEHGNIAAAQDRVFVLVDADGRQTSVGPVQTSETTLPNGQGKASAGVTVGVGPRIPGFKSWWSVFVVDPASGSATLWSKRFEGRPWSISVGPSYVWIGTTTPGNEFGGSLERYDITGLLLDKISVPGKPISIDATTTPVLAVIQTPGDLPNRLLHIQYSPGPRIVGGVDIRSASRVAVGPISGRLMPDAPAYAWVYERGNTTASLVRVLIPGMEQRTRVRIPIDTFSFGVEYAVVPGAIWVVEEFPEKLLWIDPTTARIRRITQPGTIHAQAIAADERAIWLAEGVLNRGTLYRIDVATVAR